MEHEVWGAYRMTEALRREEGTVKPMPVRRLLRQIGSLAVDPKPRLSLPAFGQSTFPYLRRGLSVKRPHQVRTIDRTNGSLRGSFTSLVALLESFSCYVLAWKPEPSPIVHGAKLPWAHRSASPACQSYQRSPAAGDRRLTSIRHAFRPNVEPKRESEHGNAAKEGASPDPLGRCGLRRKGAVYSIRRRGDIIRRRMRRDSAGPLDRCVVNDACIAYAVFWKVSRGCRISTHLKLIGVQQHQGIRADFLGESHGPRSRRDERTLAGKNQSDDHVRLGGGSGVDRHPFYLAVGTGTYVTHRGVFERLPDYC
ncbi:hypothetical protein MAMT_02168 [Methylacidimicrobium tartarophylax]|uniref:Uncharacterized protein n=1 Tax=Methylacidimicrobium tartarophylax TaxID=1041768 RepID=A0A5E6MFX9_9BACT|nr:hypothetical protein MAMT_02168 [Methylacidimicrobium tartarophylax]